MPKIIFTLFLLLWASAVYADDEYKGFHLGTVSGAGIAISDGNVSANSQLSLNLEVGYDFGNQLDVLGRFGYSPLLGVNDETLPITNFDFGVKFVPFSTRFTFYVVQLLGFYISNSPDASETEFNSQTAFHNVSGFGVQFHITHHHMIGAEMNTQYFFNDASNISTLTFNGVYRYTF